MNWFVSRLGANLFSSGSLIKSNIQLFGFKSTSKLWTSSSPIQRPLMAASANHGINTIISRNLSILLPTSRLNHKEASIHDKTVSLNRSFHAAGSKVGYLDFRYRYPTNHLRLHLLIIRRKKMKKHQRRKFRKKFKFMLEKKRMKREIAKEKLFRVELLSMIRKAENFDAKQYALKCITKLNSKPKEQTEKDRADSLKELIRKHRYQVNYIKPKHRSADY